MLRYYLRLSLYEDKLKVGLSMLEIIENTSFRSIIWDLFLILLGIMIPSISLIIRNSFKRRTLKRRLKNLADIEDLNIVKMSSGIPKYSYDHIQIKKCNRSLFLAFPIEAQTKIKKKYPDFVFHENQSFDGESNFSDIVKETGMSDLLERIDRHKLIIANKFVNQEDGCLFNAQKFGIYKFSTNRVGEHEEPSVRVDLFQTDYFTHRVFRSVYQELKEEGHPISKINQKNITTSLRKYRAFLTSFGLNAYLITDSRQGESIIFSKRSENAAYSENQFKYNSTVMEGITEADYSVSEDKLLLQSIIERALFEELGIAQDHFSRYDTEMGYCDFFLENNYLEIGMTAYIKMDAVFEESIRDLPAQDKELEISQLTPVRLNKREIEQFINNNRIYAQGLFTLKMILARESIFINIKKNQIHLD